ncbi:MAG: sigma 54-interacting transcriptional regulator [Steroidobacteraceae bacterium]
MHAASHDVSEQAVPLASARPLLGASAAMREVLHLIERVGPTQANVLLTGESGTGKELAARWIHDRSLRRGGPFVAANCGVIPAEPLEAELFERARGGTLLLDEVTEMPLGLQTRLLGLLETRRLHHAGPGCESSADVRVIAATNRCPLLAVQNGQLRDDLLYRLAVFPIEMPPLRSRGSDVDLLTDHFLAELNARSGTHKRLSALARMALTQHTWPGNVRELKNCIEQAFILADHRLELVPLIQNSRAGGADPAIGRECLDVRVGSRIEDVERSLIEATLDHFQGNKRRAANALGCSLKTLYNKLQAYSQSREYVNS